MKSLPNSVEKLIEHFSKLPGVGPKSASRMAFYLLTASEDRANSFAEAITEMKHSVQFCRVCHNISEEPECLICSNDTRDKHQIMVVEDVLDLLAFEKTSEYKGAYHVLGGVISPVNGIGPEDINLASLKSRLNKLEGEVELILATNPNMEGEATAMYIKEEVADSENIKLTRIARGVPSGADLDYADKTTLSRALSGRTNL